MLALVIRLDVTNSHLIMRITHDIKLLCITNLVNEIWEVEGSTQLIQDLNWHNCLIINLLDIIIHSETVLHSETASHIEAPLHTEVTSQSEVALQN